MRLLLFMLCSIVCRAQTVDVFAMVGTDVVVPGAAIKGNYNVGLGYYPKWISNPIFNEVTASYTYETRTHTEAIGLMETFPIHGRLSGYGWVQAGITSFLDERVSNRLYLGYSIGAAFKLARAHSFWVQETVNQIMTVPLYTTASLGYTFSF